jgi:hypothetical protein
MGLFEKLDALVEDLRSIPKELHQLTIAIHQATERHSNESHRANAPPERIEVHTSPADDTKQQSKQLTTQRLIAGGTWAAFFAASWYACVAIQQWKEMRAQTAQMQRQVRQDQRPWMKIGVDPEHRPNVVDGSEVTAAIQIQNTGKTPARELTVQTRLNVLPSSQAPVLPESIEAYKSMSGLGWAQTSGIRFPEDKPVTDFEVSWFDDGWRKHLPTLQDSYDWTQGRSWVAVYGEVDYADIFGVPHWTKFCLAFTGTSVVFEGMTVTTSRACSDYNNADNNSDSGDPGPKSRWSRIWSAIWD